MLNGFLKTPFISALFYCFVGFAIQIQMTIGTSNGAIGLRVNLGDIILPFAGVLVLGTLLTKKTCWPRWRMPLGLFWPAILSMLICFAMWNGHRITGEWSQWAIINKFIGWFVLMAYFALGAWAATNFGEKPLTVLLKVFLLTSIIISSGHLLYIILPSIGLIPAHPYYQLTGFMGNRNAMGLLLIMTFSLLIVPAAANQSIIHPWIYRGFMAILPLIVIYNESRAVWVAFLIPVIGVIFFFKQKGIKTLALPAIALIFTFLALTALDRADITIKELRSGDVFVSHNDGTIYAGDYQRLRVLSDSIDFLKEHPVTGIGLGSFLYLQKEKYGESETVALGIIDSTPLWITTEFGAIGATAFCLFYFFVIYTLSKANKGNLKKNPYDALRISLLLFLLAFGVMSIFHELLYTRFVWLLLGMALAVSREELEGVRANP